VLDYLAANDEIGRIFGRLKVMKITYCEGYIEAHSFGTRASSSDSVRRYIAAANTNAMFL
jgi:hypothetical protein